MPSTEDDELPLSEVTLSTLSESGGRSAYVLLLSQSLCTDLTSMAGDVVDGLVSTSCTSSSSATVSTQKVSLFHNLQLRFSSRRPFSNESAHFENTTRISHN